MEYKLKLNDYGDGFANGYKVGYADGSGEFGCEDCAFESTEEWEMPCVRCKRGCRDYYRRASEVE